MHVNHGVSHSRIGTAKGWFRPGSGRERLPLHTTAGRLRTVHGDVRRARCVRLPAQRHTCIVAAALQTLSAAMIFDAVMVLACVAAIRHTP